MSRETNGVSVDEEYSGDYDACSHLSLYISNLLRMAHVCFWADLMGLDMPLLVLNSSNNVSDQRGRQIKEHKNSR